MLAAALIPALLFNGVRVEFFALYLILLFLCLALFAAQWHKAGVCLSNTAVTLCLTLFWLWLGVSLLWHPVPQVGFNYFWIVGTLPLAFWVYTAAVDPDALWRKTAPLILITGLVLALWAVYQWGTGMPPRSVFLDINSHAAFLNLIALPASACFLLQPADRRRSLHLLGAALFVLFFAIMLTKGRGAIASFFLGFLLLLWLVRGYVPVQRSRVLLLLALLALLLANLLWQGGVLGRLGTLANPASADLGRLQIWAQAWKMLGDAPWYGMGIGTFWLAWPPYRHPADGSGGYFAHNDYLQIWIEAGWPGLLLLLILLGSVAWTFARVLRNPPTSSLSLEGRDTSTFPLPLQGGEGGGEGVRLRVEMTGLFAGLLAVAAQSFVNFNLYISPTLLVAGLVLARFNHLGAQTLGNGQIQLVPAQWLKPRAYYTLIVLLAAFPLVYFATQGASALYYKAALAQASRGELEQAYQSLTRAARFTPSSDSVLATHADLVRYLLRIPDEVSAEDKKLLYEFAMELLDKAQRLNPYRPQVFMTRGQLYEENQEIAGEDWAEQAQAAYLHAIALDPRYHQARVRYAALLLRQGRLQEARRVLDQGMPYVYVQAPDLYTYYDLTRQVLALSGETARAEWLSRELQPLARALKLDQQPPRAEDKGVKLN